MCLHEGGSNSCLHEKEKDAKLLIKRIITMELTEKQKSEVGERLRKII